MDDNKAEYENVDQLTFDELKNHLADEGFEVPEGLSGKVKGAEVSGTIELQPDTQVLRIVIEDRPSDISEKDIKDWIGDRLFDLKQTRRKTPA